AEARAALARLETSASGPAPAAPIFAEADPWEVAPGAPPSAASQAGLDRATGAKPWFVDDAMAAGLVFTFHNGETPIRQMPVALSGGGGLFGFGGDRWCGGFRGPGGPFPP